MTYQIYKINNKHNGKLYVGITSQALQKRWYQHCVRKSKSALSAAIRKHGRDSFIMESIMTVPTQEEAFNQETNFIKSLHSHITEHGYNMNYGGCGASSGSRPNAKWSKSRHQKMSAMFRSIDKSYMQSESYKTSMRSVKAGKHIGEGNPLYGRRGSTNPKSHQYQITYSDGTSQTIWGGEEKRNWIAIHKISNSTFQKMIHQSEYQHSSGIRVILI